MRSGLYEGRLVHRRHAHEATGQVAHQFAYRVALPLLFLDELDDVASLHPLWSSRRPNAVWFRRGDFLGNPSRPLDVAVRDAAEKALGRRPTGPIAMLAQLRTWGWSFNPITVFYCYDKGGKEIDALVLEVTSTPWLERHVYVVDGAEGVHCFPKAMHVSPFMGMDHDYVLSSSIPGERLTVQLGNRQGQDHLFDASLTLQRRELTRSALGGLVWHHPQASYRSSAAIYRQALALARKGAPFRARRRAVTRNDTPAMSSGGAVPRG